MAVGDELRLDKVRVQLDLVDGGLNLSAGEQGHEKSNCVVGHANALGESLLVELLNVFPDLVLGARFVLERNRKMHKILIDVVKLKTLEGFFERTCRVISLVNP